MFSKLIVLCLTAACVAAAPAPTDVVPLEKQQPTVIPIVSQSEELESNGTYKFSYETANGIKREETSYDKVVPKAEGRSAAGSSEGGESGESDEIHVQLGSYSYTAPDGTVISVRYIADENGFRPVGDHIPQSIVAAAAAAGSSGENSGRALSATDSADSASAPAAASAPAPTAKSGINQAKLAPESPIEPKAIAPSTESAKVKDASGETTESANEASPSTTEAASTANATNDASTSASEGTTLPAEVKTEGTSESLEPSSVNADASTTEASTTANV